MRAAVRGAKVERQPVQIKGIQPIAVKSLARTGAALTAVETRMGTSCHEAQIPFQSRADNHC